jgi:hypothetical protein
LTGFLVDLTVDLLVTVVGSSVEVSAVVSDAVVSVAVVVNNAASLNCAVVL